MCERTPVWLTSCHEDQGSSHHSGGNSHSEKLCNKSHQESSQNTSCCKVATPLSSQYASCCEVATLQSSQNASCCEVATLKSSLHAPCYKAAPLGGLRGRLVQECILTCLILLAYSTFLTGNKICRYTLLTVQSFCLCVCRRFSEMFWGLFHKQGDGGFTSDSTEIENRSL